MDIVENLIQANTLNSTVDNLRKSTSPRNKAVIFGFLKSLNFAGGIDASIF